MKGGFGAIANIIGLFTTVAIVALLAAKPQIVTNFFSGVAGATRAATLR